jgi:hypothetical protein
MSVLAMTYDILTEIFVVFLRSYLKIPITLCPLHSTSFLIDHYLIVPLAHRE